MAVNVKINGVTYRATDDYSIKQQGGAISTTQLRVLLGLNPVPSILQQVQIYMDATLFFTGLIQRVSSPEYSSAYEANVFSIDVSSLECLFNHRLVTKNFYDYTYTSWTQVIQYLFDNYIAEENITMGAISTISTTFDSKYSVKDKKLTDVLNEIADAIGPASWWVDPATRQFYFRVAADFDIVTPPEHVREFKLVDEIGDIRTEEKITGASAGVVGSASNGTLRTTIAARTGGSGKIEYAESDNDIHSDVKAAAEAGYRLNLHDETQKTITCICEDLAASAVYLSWPLDITINGIAIEGDFVVVERTIEARGPDLFSIRVTLKNNNYFARYGYSLKRVATIANNSIALLSDIAADSKLTPGEKITELARWNAELATKAAYDAEADAYGVSRVAYDAAFTALSTYLNAGSAWTSGTPAWFDGEAFTETTDIVGADYDDNWQVLLDAKRSLEINTRLAIQEAADDAIAAAHKASIRLKVSDQRIIRARNGDLTPAFIVLTSWYSDNGTAYAGRLQVELSVNGADFVVDYQSSADEATHSYTVPALYGSAFVILLRCRLYEAGGFSNVLWETSAAINADPSAAAIYWGALTSAPTGDIQANDYYFDNNTVAGGGGKLRYYTGSAWAEMTSAHPLYAHAYKTAITDIMVWATAQGETVAAANAVFESIVAAEAFIDKLATDVLNAAIALINEQLIISNSHGYVAGPDGDTGLTLGDLRSYLDQDEIAIQEYKTAGWADLIAMKYLGRTGYKGGKLLVGPTANIFDNKKTGKVEISGMAAPVMYKGLWTKSDTFGTPVSLTGPMSSYYCSAVIAIPNTTKVLYVYTKLGGMAASILYDTATNTAGTEKTTNLPAGGLATKLAYVDSPYIIALAGTHYAIYNSSTDTWSDAVLIDGITALGLVGAVYATWTVESDGSYTLITSEAVIDGRMVALNIPADFSEISADNITVIGTTIPSGVGRTDTITYANGDISFFFDFGSAIYEYRRTAGTWGTASFVVSHDTDDVAACLNPDETVTLIYNNTTNSRLTSITRTGSTWGTPVELTTLSGNYYNKSICNSVSGKRVYTYATSSAYYIVADGSVWGSPNKYGLYYDDLGAGITEYGVNSYGRYATFGTGIIIYDPTYWINLNIASPLTGANVTNSFVRRCGDILRLRLSLSITAQTITNGTTIATFNGITKTNGASPANPHRGQGGADTTTVRQNCGFDVDVGAGVIKIYWGDGIGLGGSVANVTGIFADLSWDLQ